MQLTRQNNFDLIRLFAALQVVIQHSRHHLKIQHPFLDAVFNYFLSFFPGVPIFFFVSGFLVYASFERNSHSIKNFYRNRVLRIFPALWACLLITIILLFWDYPARITNLLTTKEMLIWLVGQLSVFQFYTPEVLRFWGVGTPNGSLWTITVEIQFYLILPLLFFLFRSSKRGWLVILIVFVASVMANSFIGNLKIAGNTIGKLGAVTILPYLYYFLIGMIAYLLRSLIMKYLKDKFWLWTGIYLLLVYTVEFGFNFNATSYWVSSPFNLIADWLLAAAVLSFAFSFRGISHKLLVGNDISYGVYIYHMLVVNFLVHRGCFQNGIYFAIAVFGTIGLAWLSWNFVEKPALKLKRNTLTT